ncbi:MAG: thioredoxin family protein [Nanoarchaeota archaeon]
MKHGDKAPEFSLPATDGKTYSLADFKEAKAVLVVFMCNHCPYVHPKIEEMKRITADFKDQGLVVVGINSNEDINYPDDSFENMKKVAAEKGFNFIYLRDESQDVANAYSAVCTPDPFLFDAEFKLVFHSRIDDKHGEVGKVKELHQAIGEFLETRKITVEEQPSMGCSIKWKY